MKLRLRRALAYFDLTRVAESGLQSHDFLAGTVLAEVDSQLSSAFEKAYSPGIPQEFHQELSRGDEVCGYIRRPRTDDGVIESFPGVQALGIVHEEVESFGVL